MYQTVPDFNKYSLARTYREKSVVCTCICVAIYTRPNFEQRVYYKEDEWIRRVECPYSDGWFVLKMFKYVPIFI